ncbi:MAG: EamA family transporter [Alphaproteobacteria bacterium]|nr:EamA family transporter [Alphaproteobacteria bacterium]
MQPAPNNNFKGALFSLIAYGIYSTHDIFIKLLGGSHSPIQIIFFSGLLGFPLVTLMLIKDRTAGHLRPIYPGWTAIRCTAMIANALGAFIAFANLPLAQAYAILFAMPLLITVLSIPILKETVKLRRWTAVIVGLLGVLVVLQPGTAELSWAHLAALISAVGGATNSVIVRKIGQEERSVVLILYPMMATFLAMGVMLPFVYEPMAIEHFGLVSLVALFSFIAMFCLISAYRFGEAVIVAPMQYSQMLWAIAYGYLIFNESIDLATALGSGLIIASGLYILFRESKGENSENTPVLKTRTRSGTVYSLRISFLTKLTQKTGAMQDSPGHSK